MPVPPSRGDSTDTNVARPTRRGNAVRWLIHPVTVAVGVYAAGLLAGDLLLRWWSPTPHGAVSQARRHAELGQPSEADSEPAAPARSHEAANAQAMGDSLLAAGSAAAALRQYEALAALGQGRDSPDLSFRIALCAESLGDLERALAEYRRLLSRSPPPHLEAAVRLSQVRVWLHLGRPALAKQLLWSAMLDSGRLGLCPDRVGSETQPTSRHPAASAEIRAEYVQRLAQILAQQARQGREPRRWKDIGIADPLLPSSPAEVLSWAAASRAAPGKTVGAEHRAHVSEGGGAGSVSPLTATPSESELPRVANAPRSPDSSVEVLRRGGPQPEEIFVRVRLPDMPLAAVLDEVLRPANLKLQWSDAARQAASKHTVRLCVEDTSLAMVLDSVLDPLELWWEASGNEVQVASDEEGDEQAKAAFRVALAERMLRHVVTNFPEHELTDEAYWALGNLQFDRGQYAAAVVQYEQYLRQFPQARVQTGVHFNLAKAYLLRDRRDLALQHFYRVADGAVDEDYLWAAYLYLGRLYLEDDSAARAVKPLTRGLALARESSEEAVAALTLTEAYLQCGNAHSANRILMDHRAMLEKGPFYDHAAWLAALARYRAAQTASLREKEGRSLIAAMTHVTPAGFFGAQGYVLLAEAYRDLGLLSDMQRVLIEGLQRPHLGAMGERMRFGAAEYYRRTGQRDKCQEVLNLLAQETHGDWGQRAKVALADVAFQAHDDETCLRQCHELLAAPLVEADRKQVLQLVGRVLERQGNYHGAALCFAGLPPRASPPPEHAREERQ